MAASSKFVTDAINNVIFMSAGMEKSIKYSQDQSSIMLLFEHNFFCFGGDAQKHNAQILERKLYITLLLTNPKQIS